jgi:FAD/FMN-containing dehydrogenase
MLIDLSRLHECIIDPAGSAAIVQPSVTAAQFAAELGRVRLAFPVGHASSVALGGYLLAGGFGWNMGAWGPACFSVTAIEVVTAGGDVVRADADHNAELFWAARGAGSGFFGVATRFWLNVYPLPASIRESTYVCALAEVEEISRWSTDVSVDLPRKLDLLVAIVGAPPGLPAGPAGKAVVISAIAFGDSDEEAEQLLQIARSCPSIERALVRLDDQPSSFEALHQQIDGMLPAGSRYAEDSLWSDRPQAELLPPLAEQLVGAPSPASKVMSPVFSAARRGTLPDAAFSMADRSFALCYAIWEEEADDEPNIDWLRRSVRSVQPLTVGRYIAENDLRADGLRAESSFAPANWERLEALKAKFDPHDLFHGYLGSQSK